MEDWPYLTEKYPKKKFQSHFDYKLCVINQNQLNPVSFRLMSFKKDTVTNTFNRKLPIQKMKLLHKNKAVRF